MTNYSTDDVILTSSVQYDSSAAGYGELCVWFYPIRNGEIFRMNNNKLLLLLILFQKHLGAVLSSRSYLKGYVSEKVGDWVG